MVRPIKLGNAKCKSSIQEMKETFSTLEKKIRRRYDSKRKEIILGSGGDPFMYAVTPDQIEGTHHFHLQCRISKKR